MVYEEDMKKTVEKVRNLLQLRLMQIDKMAHGWHIGSKEFDTPKQLEELALAVKILPFIKDRSVFTGLSPVGVNKSVGI